MEKVKNKNGISLIVLVITILVMIILAGVVIVTMSENNPINKAKEANFKSDIATFQEDLSMHIANKLAMDSALKVTDIDAKGYDAIKKVVNSFTKKYENKIEVVDGKIVYVGTDKDELAWAGGAGVTSKAGLVNAPVLSSGMIPVKYNGTKWEICDSKDPSWYNYENKQWANVMLSDGKYKAATLGTVVEDADLGSMFVWIPRFAYSINKYKTAPTGAEGQTQNIHDISFLIGTSDSDVYGKTYPKTYDATKVSVGQATPKIVHPAFNFGGVEKQGIWVAKFEASMQTGENVKVVPGAVTWREIEIGNAMTKCMEIGNKKDVYGITSGVDSHLMRNSDWGATSIIATSKYGSTPTINSENKSLGNYKYEVYAGGSGSSYQTNVSQSTTRNATGIYDMNGGAWEYVAACYANKSRTLQQYAPLFFTGSVVNPQHAKYLDIYTASSKELDPTQHSSIWNSAYGEAPYTNAYKKDIAKERFANLSQNNGHALYECIQEGRYSFFGRTTSNNMTWLINVDSHEAEYGRGVYNDDFALIGHTDFSFMLRGGFWGDGNSAGIFATYNLLGGASYDLGFRPVIINI